jgi:hypothetical protein
MTRQMRQGFDWDEFWERTGEEDQMRIGALRMANRLCMLI